jgi:heptaprenyl diphosphate synthase
MQSGLPLDLPSLGTDLGRVEVALKDSVATEDPMLTEVARSLILAGGKRLRPVLTLATSYLGGASGDRPVSDAVIQGAVAVELVHLGSLYHDDVMDEAATRRGVETANARYGNFVAIVAGDFCLAVSAQIAASLGVEVSQLLGFTIGELCKGQVRELQYLYKTDRPEDAYFASIDGKTASLMAAACRVGAITAGLSPQAIEAVTTYGQRVGMVFQIADDILDVIATDEQLGKPAGNDVVEGVFTLPVIRSLKDPQHGEELMSLLTAGVDRNGVEHVRKLVRASCGLDEAVQVGRTYADEAQAALAGCGDPAVIAQLGPFGHVLLDRLPL